MRLVMWLELAFLVGLLVPVAMIAVQCLAGTRRRKHDLVERLKVYTLLR